MTCCIECITVDDPQSTLVVEIH